MDKNVSSKDVKMTYEDNGYKRYMLGEKKRKRSNEKPSFIKMFLISSIIFSTVYSYFIIVILYPSEPFSLKTTLSPILVGSAIGFLLGLIFGGFSQIYRNRSNDVKAYIWVCGIFYPGVAALMTWVIVILAVSPLTLQIFFIGHVVSVVVVVIVVGCSVMMKGY
ncbi:MAG: hypothetical protein ACTSVZ_01155 [Promethearchaeota archaeon]